MAIKLRDYQQEVIENTIQALRNGYKKILINCSVGGGKTIIATKITEGAVNKNKRLLFLCHRTELIEQAYRTFQMNDIIPGFICSGKSYDYKKKCYIGMINTVINRLDTIGDFDIIIVDEAHHIMSSTWSKVINHFSNSVVLGLTATPCRLDGKPLGKMFDYMVIGPQTNNLISRGFLTPFDYYAPTNLDTNDIKISNGDFQKKDLDIKIKNTSIIGDNIEHYKKIAMGKRNVVFACNRIHALSIVEKYNSNNIKAELLDGTLSSHDRKKIIDNFYKGTTLVVVAIDIISEGFDLPSIEVVSMLRPTMSLSLCIQQWGRGLRLANELGKTKCIILDHVNNYQRHGMPDDQREWSLSGGLTKKRKTEQSTESIMRCPKCFFAHSKALSCPNCGYTYTTKEKQIQEVAGELVLIGSQEYKNARQRETLNVSSLDELVKIEKDRGYKFGFAERQWQLKTGENLWSNVSGLEKIAKARGYSDSWVWVQKNKVRNKRCTA